MKILFLFVVLSFTLKAQIFTETFSNFPGDTTGATGYWRFVDSYHDEASGDSIYEDLTLNGNDLKTFNGYANYAAVAAACTQPSVTYSGGNALVFNGSSHSIELPDNTKLNPGTADFVWQAWVYRADYTSGVSGIFGKYQDANNRLGWWIDASGFTTTYARDVGVYGWFFANTANPFTDGKWHRLIVWGDRSDTLKCYVDGVQVTFAQTSINAATNITNTANVTVGAFLTSFFNGAIDELIFTYGSLFSDQQIKESGFLAKDWKSGGGNVIRQRGSGALYKFHQGIKGSGITVKAKGSGFSYTPTLTTDSTRYTFQLGATYDFSSDSIMLKTDTDSVWHELPDTVLASTDGLQVVFDAWETGGVVYVDNITLSGYTLPVSTATTGKFKGSSGWNKFKGW